ncbi:uncharacterized protein LOC119359128 [Triticum dicoccoides]|uniref:At1g61320/AtMIF1 LRR domain-containing protein n=1 Tax=Triticum turgidum subsp. durum TaxID=4567 RepID=A0A9R1R4A9_TRITD|nr:uncharacterized protein LOC119359128 [Triticum dicoccoides]VAH27737.1 unnamed protein product [Triticum turgidum subsp. durum]
MLLRLPAYPMPFRVSYPRLDFDMYTLGLLDVGRRLLSFGPIDKELPAIEDQLRRGVIATFDEYYEKNSPIIKEFSARVDHIMHNHVGTGVQTFRLVPPYGFYINPAVLDRWFQAVIAPGISEFGLYLDMGDEGLGYNFPCSLLSSSNRGCSTIASFSIAGCGLHSLDRVGCLISLCVVHLHRMRVTGEQLICFLSASPGLQQLQLSYCNDVVCLKIPHSLWRLKLLLVRNCNSLQTIGCDAPQLKSFGYDELPTTQICLGDSSPLVRDMRMSGMDDEPTGMLCYATTKLPSVAPNISSLVLSSCFEIATPMKKLNKFRRLKYLEIQLHTPRRCPDFDFYSLVSILNACPVLATFILRLEMRDADDAIPGDPHGDSSQWKTHMRGQGHRKLKNVLVRGFPSAKGLVELTSHILETAASLKRLVLETAYGCHTRDCIGICSPLTRKALLEARKAVGVIKTYVEGKVPSTVKFKLIEPCAKCHADHA